MTETADRRAPDLVEIRLGDVRVHALSEPGCVEHVLDVLDAGAGGWVITANLDHLRRAARDAEYHAMLDAADVVVADGMPLLWAARVQGTPLPERVAGSNLISSLTAGAAERGRSVYLLGGDPGTAERAATVLTERCPGLRVAGTDCPAPGFDRDDAAVARIAAGIADAAPDIVYVALGSPKQERLIARIRDARPGAWWIGVGISFSFLCGEVRRAPRWMQRSGLEWVHRLCQEPRRLARRYLVEGLPFAARLLAGSAARRFRHE
jgi:N-acetylglucosaminyldiphosphoundecaprenol N-acetyl-beta-D-mannosaminyltransferase